MYICVCLCHSACTCGGQRPTHRVSSLRLPCGSWELNLGHPSWGPEPFPAELPGQPSPVPLLDIFSTSYCYRSVLSSAILTLPWKARSQLLSFLFRGGTEIIAFSQLQSLWLLNGSLAVSSWRVQLGINTDGVSSLCARADKGLLTAPTASGASGWKPNTHDWRPQWGKVDTFRNRSSILFSVRQGVLLPCTVKLRLLEMIIP